MGLGDGKEYPCFICKKLTDRRWHVKYVGELCWDCYGGPKASIPTASVTDPVLPTDSDARKAIPIFSGVLNYFPLAIAAVARLSKRGNDKHNPGQPLHWSRDKSTDHPDCIARHLIDHETQDAVTGEYEDAVAMAWRALALLQTLEEKRLGKPYSRGSK